MARALKFVSILMAVNVLCCAGQPAMALDSNFQYLDSDSIAARSLAVAESMKTSGYCYAGVSKALLPLGVTLTGAAAYEARDQLLVDSRFVPISTDDSVDVRRGDIIVFNKSVSHPYGHICVYQGNGQESSDHVSRLTSPDGYGGFTVFRLRSETSNMAGSGTQEILVYKMPAAAPDFRSMNGANDTRTIPAEPDKFGGFVVKERPQSGSKAGTNSDARSVNKRSGSLKQFFQKEYRVFSNSASGRSIKNKLVRFVLNNL